MIRITVSKQYLNKGTPEQYLIDRLRMQKGKTDRATPGAGTAGRIPIIPDMTSWWPSNVWVSEFYD